MMVMQETAVRPILEQMEEQARAQLVEAEKAEGTAQCAYNAAIARIADLERELRGFASLLGRGPERLIAEFRDRPGWDRIPPEQIPARFRARQSRADSERYDACRERDAALLRLQRATGRVAEVRSVIAEFELLMDQSDEVLVGFLRRRGWQIRELMRNSA